jgi:NodT family efflux transporter outer membrane factor (OMF) lipoprotein
MGVAILMSAAALSGCATAVPVALPANAQPQHFTGPIPSPAQIWPDASWWRSFGDPQLTSLVEEAERNNGDLAVAVARVLEAKAQAGIQRSALFPEIDGGAGHSNGGCNGQSCAQFTNTKAFELNFNASYELDFWGLARDNLRAADEQLKSARFAQQSVALTVAASAASQYLNVLALRSRIAIANENIASINGILDIIKLRVKTGSTSHLDLAREEAQVEAVDAQLPVLETTEKQAEFALAVLLGRPPEGFEVAGGTLNAVKPPAVGPGLPSALLLRRPDIAQAEADLAAAHANVDAARAAFLPQISLTGSGGFISAAVGTLVQGSNFGYGYGANLLQTIFDGGKLMAQKDLAKATEQEFVARYRTAAFSAYGDVETALVQVANTGREHDHLEREVAAAREAFEISQLQYRQGAADLLTILQAQQTLFSAEDQLVQVMLANRQASVQLFEALGGGWVEKPGEQTQVSPKIASMVAPKDHSDDHAQMEDKR